MEVLAGLSLFVAVVAAAVAIWQGIMARQQLELARKAESNTAKTLTEVKDVSRDTLASVRQVERDLEERINKFLEHQVKDMDLQLRARESEQRQKEQDAQQGAEMAAGVMNFLGDVFKESWAEAKEANTVGDDDALGLAESDTSRNDESDPPA